MAIYLLMTSRRLFYRLAKTKLFIDTLIKRILRPSCLPSIIMHTERPKLTQLPRWYSPMITTLQRNCLERCVPMLHLTPLIRIWESQSTKRMILLSQQVLLSQLGPMVQLTTRKLLKCLKRLNQKFTMEDYQELVLSSLFSVRFSMLMVMALFHMLTLKALVRNFKFKQILNQSCMLSELSIQNRRGTLITDPSRRKCNQVWVIKLHYSNSKALMTSNYLRYQLLPSSY